jgi:hypothetical protein
MLMLHRSPEDRETSASTRTACSLYETTVLPATDTMMIHRQVQYNCSIHAFPVHPATGSVAYTRVHVARERGRATRSVRHNNHTYPGINDACHVDDHGFVIAIERVDRNPALNSWLWIIKCRTGNKARELVRVSQARTRLTSYYWTRSLE